MDHDGGDGPVHGPPSRIPQLTDPALADRHAWLAGLIAPEGGERVVDLGCGESPLLGLIQPRLDGGVAVGIDNSAEALREARASLSASASRTLFLQSDLAAPLPLADGSMDVAFSHDVLEQLPDPDALLREVCRVLRPGGRFVLGHADFDTVVFAGADVELTRRLVHAYCDTQHAWMPRADGTIGRRLPEIVLGSPLALSGRPRGSCSPGAWRKAASVASRSITSWTRSPKPGRPRRRSWPDGAPPSRRRPLVVPSCSA
jgi:SAM-dependent methyltransferase